MSVHQVSGALVREYWCRAAVYPLPTKVAESRIRQMAVGVEAADVGSLQASRDKRVA